MSSSYKGHWINGSKNLGYTAQPYNGEVLPNTLPTVAAVKRYIDSLVAKGL